MRQKIFYFVGIFAVLVLIFLVRLYYPTPFVEKDAQVSKEMKEVWQPYATDSFQVLLPSLPQHIKEKMPLTNSQEVISYDMYLVQQPIGSTFMVSIIQYPDTYDTSDAKQLLEAITNEMLSNNSESQLVSSKQGSFLGKPSLDNTIRNGALYIYMKAFISGKTLFVVNVVDSQEERVKANFEKVLNSFQLITPVGDT